MKLERCTGVRKFLEICGRYALYVALPPLRLFLWPWCASVAFVWQRLFVRRGRFTPQLFRQELDIAGVARTEHTLVHPTLPSASSVGLWYSAARDRDQPGSVKLRLVERSTGARVASSSQSAGYAGSITALVPAGAYDATLVLDGEELPSVPVCTAPQDDVAFSFLAYSCLAPFPSKGDNAPLQRTLRSLKLLAQRSAGPGPGAGPGSSDTVPSDTVPPKPAFALALGDQVYVDNGVQTLFPPKRALLFGWRSEYPRYPKGATATEIEAYFRELYDAYLRIASYEESLRAIPHAMMWDDHDIRDGWGSQGDEPRAKWGEYFAAARAAFLAHQHARNPSVAGQAAAGQLATRRNEWHFDFDWGAATRFFVMDLRSARKAARAGSQVVSPQQLQAIRDWLSAGGQEPRRPRLYVLVTALPLTHGAENTWSLSWRPWFRADDRKDNWWSKESRPQRDALLRALHEHFSGHRDDRLLVLSGDVHFGEILSLTIEGKDRARVFGHEVISSGLAQSSYHATCDRKETQRLTPLVTGLSSRSAGSRLFAPHFAEIFVSKGNESEAPGVEVLFYPSEDPVKKQLVNPPERLHELCSRRLPLPVGAEAPETPLLQLPSFDHFIL